MAQNAYIGPTTGRLLHADTKGLGYNETGATKGWCGLWRHRQLPLTLIASDKTDLNPGGMLGIPAGNMNLNGTGADERLVVLAGETVDCYLSVSLPAGYRFTGYRMVLLNNLSGTVGSFTMSSSISKQMTETNETFATDKAQTDVIPAAANNAEYTLARTSTNGGADMGNHLYFRLKRNGGSGDVALTVKSFVVYFSPEGTKEIVMAPAVPDATKLKLRHTQFETGIPDLGELTRTSTDAGDRLSFVAKDMRSLAAFCAIHQGNAEMGDGTFKEDAAAVSGDGHIQAVGAGGEMWYGLDNGTYIVETANAVTNSDGKSTAPLGYRIVGAEVECGIPAAQQAETGVNKGLIYYTDEAGATYYLTRQGRFTNDASKAEVWKAYLSAKPFQDGEGAKFFVCTTDEKVFLDWEATDKRYDLGGWQWGLKTRSLAEMLGLFNGTGGSTRARVFYQVLGSESFIGAKEPEVAFQPAKETYALQGEPTDLVQPVFRTLGAANQTLTLPSLAAVKYAALVKPYVKTAYTPKAFTVKVWGHEGESTAQTASMTVGSANQPLTLSGLNDDCIMVKINELSANSGAVALVRVKLKVQPLNPYVARVTADCTGNNATISQTYAADDFTITGGTLKVPTALGTPTLSFRNLYNAYGYSGYNDGSADHNSLYRFVNDSSTDPRAATTWGTTPFTASNLDALAGGTATAASDGKYYYTETAFDPDTYTFSAPTLTSSQTLYLLTQDKPQYCVADEAHLNHAAYACYAMPLTFEAKDYVASTGTPADVYNGENTCYPDGDDDDKQAPVYGLTLGAKENATDTQDATDGYLTVSQVKTALSGLTSPTAKDLVYLDLSGATLIEDGEDNTIESLRDLLGKNAIIYLNEKTSTAADNCAQKQADGTYRACGDFVLTDKQPFYAPHNVQLPAANAARYTRNITVPENGKVTHATLVLPYAIDVDADSKHTNTDDKCAITLSKMGSISGSKNDANGYFNAMTQNAAGTVAAYTPYMVTVNTVPSGADDVFTVTQYGALVEATTGNDCTGETVNGTIDGNAYTLTCHGVVGGWKHAKAQDGSELGYFYFAKDAFRSSLDIAGQNLVVYPFRSYYTVSAQSNQMPRVLRIVFGGGDGSTSIDTTTVRATTAGVQATEGGVHLVGDADTTVRIVNAAGQQCATVSLAEGEERFVPLAQGLYIVGGVKVIVR